MNSEKSHNRMNALYFTFGALSFTALMSSVWWGGLPFLLASPFNLLLTLIGIVYIVASVISLRHAFCSPVSWLGCSCGGKSRGSALRTMALLLPIPVFAYFMYGTIIGATFDNSDKTLSEIKTRMEIDNFLFGRVEAEGMAWHYAKKAFNRDYNELADHITGSILHHMEARHADASEFEHLMKKHARYHGCDASCEAETQYETEVLHQPFVQFVRVETTQ